MRLTFRDRLLAIVGIATLAFVLLIVVSGMLARRVDAQLAAIQESYLPKVVLAPELDGAFERLRRGFQDAVAAHDLETLEATRGLEAQLLRKLGSAHGAVDAAEADALRQSLDAYFTSAFEVSRRLIANETGESLVDAMASMQAKQTRVVNAIDKVTAFDAAKLSDAFDAATRADADAQKLRLWISVACLILVLVISLGQSRRLVLSVGQLTAGFRRFGEGHFDEPIPVVSRDELGDLAAQANAMAKSLERSRDESQRAEARFRRLLESAPDAMVIVNESGRIILVNAQTEALFGFTRAELIGGDVGVLLPERLRAGSPLHSRGATVVGSENLELFGRRKDGREFPIEVRQSPLETEEGALVSSAIRDVSERKRIEADLEMSNRELEAFSYSVAHDLRAPLRGINGFSQALLEDYGDGLSAEAKDYLERIGAGSERMGLLIDALLRLSRVSRVELQYEAVDLSRAADAVMKQLRGAQPERDLTFVNQESVVAEGDPALLRAVLDNLLGNAWKFTGACREPIITFGSRRKDDVIVYFVKDNGAGFNMEYADKLFAPFQRLHHASEFAGTGVGLATVQRIVRRHGGDIWAEAAVGEGATFSFTLGTPVRSVS